MRAGDADRDATLAVIQDAFANGRLTPSETAQRQDLALASQYTDELYPIVADLPEARMLPAQLNAVVPRPPGGPKAPDGQPRYVILSGKTFDLEPGQTSLQDVLFMGGDTIHTRSAFGPGVTINIRVDAIMGGHTIYIPAGVKVLDHAESIMGGNDVSKKANGDGSNGTLILTGTLFLAGNHIKLDKSSG